MPRAYRTTLTPEQLSKRARDAALARNATDRLIQKIVDRAPELTEAQKARLAPIFANQA